MDPNFRKKKDQAPNFSIFSIILQEIKVYIDVE